MRKVIIKILMVIGCSSIFISCMSNNHVSAILGDSSRYTVRNDFDFSVNPENFELKVELDGITENVSEPISSMQVDNFNNSKDKASWSIKDKGIDVSIEKKKDYLDVSITSSIEEENNFSWPKVKGDEYILPINQGKLIPSDDEVWKEYFTNKFSELNTLQDFSMQFFAVNKSDYSIVYIIENPYNNNLLFDAQNDIEFTFNHEFPSISDRKEYGFRIYLTEKDVVDISKIYRNYMIETGKFKTLEEKAKENKNIEKLYGAPHIYFWNKRLISEENIKWNKFKGSFSSELENHIKSLLKNYIEDGEEMMLVFDEMRKEEFISNYLKQRIINVFSQVLGLKEFYNKDIFTNLDEETQKLLNKGIDKLDAVELVEFNKRLLKSKLQDVVDPIEKWGDSRTIDVLEDMKQSGLNNLWLGLDDWRIGFEKPEFIEKANEYGYLIGTYDSYHSIHEPGKEEWITAEFEDTSLYENATVSNKKGEKIYGFNGVGRKLNPTLAMDSVKSRTKSILDTGIKFNSWFLDTDGTGEVYDDYSEGRTTTQEDDINARIERTKYISDKLGMIVGTEGGNDFINPYVAFSHGIEMPVFAWMDKDMRDKESEYYQGAYYSPNGGVASLFSKQIPLKEEFRALFLSEKYNIPLYKLVYNDSVITTYWWGSPSLKFVDDIDTRMLYEMFYNIPPMYHIDNVEWEKHKNTILNHSKVWSEFSKKVINKEMVDFGFLNKDKSIQFVEYEGDIKVIVNFSDSEFAFESVKVSPKSILILENGSEFEYTPKV